MIKCHVCNTENIDGAVFCSECGAAFAPPPSPGPVYQPMPGYQMGYMPVKPGDRSRDWAAILGLILGILSIPCCFGGVAVFTDIFNYATLYIPSCVSGLIGLAGLIFSIIGMKSTKKGMAIGGLVCAIVGLLMAALFAALVSMDAFREGFYEQLRNMGY